MACVRLLAYVSLLVTACISLTPPLCCTSARANKHNTNTNTADTDTDTHAHGNGHAPQRDQTYIYAPQRDQTYSASRRLLAAALPAPLPSLQNTRTTPASASYAGKDQARGTRHAAKRQTSWAGDALLGQVTAGARRHSLGRHLLPHTATGSAPPRLFLLCSPWASLHAPAWLCVSVR